MLILHQIIAVIKKLIFSKVLFTTNNIGFLVSILSITRRQCFWLDRVFSLDNTFSTVHEGNRVKITIIKGLGGTLTK